MIPSISFALILIVISQQPESPIVWPSVATPSRRKTTSPSELEPELATRP